MYSRLQLAGKYLSYYFKASSARGHGTHSPFVYDFIRKVLNSREGPAVSAEIERYRKRLLRDHRLIPVEDFGAGSAYLKEDQRKISDIARASLKNEKFAHLLFRIATYYNCSNIIELGTSLGTTTASLAAVPGSRVTTLEGASTIADIAEDFFDTAGLENIHIIRGNFDDTLPPLLAQISSFDFLFVDGNHQEEPTIRYFQSFLDKAHNDSIMVFDDIHWSMGMENAWNHIRSHPDVSLTIDLFFVGLVFFKKEFLARQDFVIRF